MSLKVKVTPLTKLMKLCDRKDYKVVNLGKNIYIYLDPLAYAPEEFSVLQYASSKDVVTGLIITLFYSAITSIADVYLYGMETG